MDNVEYITDKFEPGCACILFIKGVMKAVYSKGESSLLILKGSMYMYTLKQYVRKKLTKTISNIAKMLFH